MSTTNRTRHPRAARRAGAIVTALALAVTLAPPALSDEVTQDAIDQSKSAEQTTATSIAELEAKLAQLSANTSAAELKAAVANEDYLTALDELSTATTDADNAQKAADAAAADTDEARTDLGAVVAETYEEGSAGTLDALAPYLSGEYLGDATDVSVALERAGENTDSQLQNVEALQAVADTMQSLADAKLEEKQDAAATAASAKADADAAATAAQTAQASAETERANLISQLAEQRNTTVELETAYQDQLEADRKAQEEAAAKEAAEQASAGSAESAQPEASAEPTESSSSAEPAADPATEPAAPAPAQSEPPAQSSGGSSSGSGGAASSEGSSSSSGTSSSGSSSSSSGGSSGGSSSSSSSSSGSSSASSQQQTTTAPSTSTSSSNKAQAAIAGAKAQLGIPYVWGGESDWGVDCSGMVMRAYRNAGVYLTHSSRVQYGQGTKIPLAQAQPGDLLFYSSNGTQPGIYHVAMYLGDGMLIDANAGRGVTIRAVWYYQIMPYAVRP